MKIYRYNISYYMSNFQLSDSKDQYSKWIDVGIIVLKNQNEEFAMYKKDKYFGVWVENSDHPEEVREFFKQDIKNLETNPLITIELIDEYNDCVSIYDNDRNIIAIFANTEHGYKELTNRGLGELGDALIIENGDIVGYYNHANNIVYDLDCENDNEFSIANESERFIPVEVQMRRKTNLFCLDTQNRNFHCLPFFNEDDVIKKYFDVINERPGFNPKSLEKDIKFITQDIPGTEVISSYNGENLPYSKQLLHLGYMLPEERLYSRQGELLSAIPIVEYQTLIDDMCHIERQLDTSLNYKLSQLQDPNQTTPELRRKADYLLKLKNLCHEIHYNNEAIIQNPNDSNPRAVNKAKCYIAHVVEERGAYFGVHSVAELIEFIAAEKIKVDKLSKEASSITRKSWKEELKLGFGLEDSSGIRALHIIPSVMIGGTAATVFAATVLNPENEVAKALDVVADSIELRDFFFNHEDFNPLSLELTDLGAFKLVGLCAALTAIAAVVAYGVIGLGRTAYDAVIVNNCYRLDSGTQYTEIFTHAISQLDDDYFRF